MKIWVGYGSEHSANLVLIGKFESAKDAEDAKDLLEEATRICMSGEQNGGLDWREDDVTFSRPMLDFLIQHSIPFDHNDPEELLNEYDVKREGDRLILTTEDLAVNAFLKIFMQKGAKVEVYSAHDHGGPYGR